MLVNYYAGNNDWSHHNWYASFNRVDPNGKWRFHSWDAEHVLRATAPIQPTSDPVQADVTTKNNANSPTEIHNRLIANPEYKLRFADRVQKHFFNGGTLTPQATDARLLWPGCRRSTGRSSASRPVGATTAMNLDIRGSIG